MRGLDNLGGLFRGSLAAFPSDRPTVRRPAVNGAVAFRQTDPVMVGPWPAIWSMMMVERKTNPR